MPNKRVSKLISVLPNEIWLEIFSKFDSNSLLGLTLVCKQWNRLIFTHMAGRFELNIDMDQRKFPLETIGMVPDRHFRNLCLRSFRLDSLEYVLDIVKRLAAELDSLKLYLVTLDCRLLQQLLALCTRIKKLEIKATYFEYGERISNQTPVLRTVKSLKLDIEHRVSTFKSVSLEMALLPCILNVEILTIVIQNPLDLVVLESLAPQLKFLGVTVSCDTISRFFKVQLPELHVLDFTLNRLDQLMHIDVGFDKTAFQQFLLGCKNLRNVTIECEFDHDLLAMIFSNLPEVRTLKLYTFLTTELFSLNGLEKMVHLKAFTLQCLLVRPELLPIVPMPTVEQVSLKDFVFQDILVDILKRFPNLKSLALPIHRYVNGTLLAIVDLAPRLEHLHVHDLVRITPGFINDVTQLTSLRTLIIDANVFARGNFRLLSNIIVLPALRSLTIDTLSNIPANIPRTVAAKNPACRLILNEELVKPPVPRPAGNRKRPAPVENSSNSQSASSTDPTGGSDGNLNVGASDKGTANFPSVHSSAPSEKRIER